MTTTDRIAVITAAIAELEAQLATLKALKQRMTQHRKDPTR